MLQIFITLKENTNLPIRNVYEVAAITASLLREDMIFCDKISYRWTVNKQEGFYSFSELFNMHYGPTYGCDKYGRVYPKAAARTINYGHLMQILKSSDEDLFKRNAWIWDGDFKFLDRSHRLLEDEGNHV